MSKRRFVCEDCGGSFTAGRSAGETIEEARRDFGVADPVAAGFALVCDDCYREIMRRIVAPRRWTPRRPSLSPEVMLEAIRAVNPAAAAARDELVRLLLDELVRLLLDGSPEEKAAAEETMRKINAEFEDGEDA